MRRTALSQKAISVALIESNAVHSHMLSASHKTAMGCKMQVSIAHFCATQLSLPTIANGFSF